MKLEGLTASEAVQALCDGWWVRIAGATTSSMRQVQGFLRLVDDNGVWWDNASFDLTGTYSIVGPPERMPQPQPKEPELFSPYKVDGVMVAWEYEIKKALHEAYCGGWFDHKAAVEKKW